jgi:ribonuclease HI
MLSDPNALKIHIDGNAFKNPGGPGGIAGIAEFPDNLERDNDVIFQRGYKATTNNRTELRACIEAMRYVIREASNLRLTRVLIISDSGYVCDNQNVVQNWRGNGWRTRDDRPIENADLWKEFLSERQKVRVSLQIIWEEGKTRP